jgi:RimJ/RimL family protein N-acetyltransferase
MERTLLESKPIEIPACHFGITLRQFTIDDAPYIFILINNNRKHFEQFGDTTSEKYKALSDVEESILQPKNEKRLRFGIWNDKDKFIGSINLTPDEDNTKRGEIGYYLSPHHTGKGHMLNSLLTLATYAFTKGGYEELYGKVHENNVASQKVLMKAGFKETGEEIDEKTRTRSIIFTVKKP